MLYQSLIIILVVLPLKLISSQIHSASPCSADVFTYFPNDSTYDTWYGQLHIFKHVTLHGVFIDLVFDNRAIMVDIDNYQTTTSDGYEFHLEDRNLKLRPGDVINLNFNVKYSANGKIPQLSNVRLNGVNICSNIEPAITREPEIKHDNRNNNNNNRNNGNGNRNNVNRGNNGKRNNGINNENKNKHKFYTQGTTNHGNSHVKPDVNVRNNLPDRNNADQSYIVHERTTTQSYEKDISSIFVMDPKAGGFDKNLKCGDIKTRTNPLVVAGEQPYFGQFPWHAALYVSSAGNLKYTCGGSLVTQYMVISAAHCVTLPHSRHTIRAENLLIYLGKYNLQKWVGHEQDVKVLDIVVHPKYNADSLHSDISVIKLKTEARYNNYIRPVCLWNFDNDLELIKDSVGSVPGWGYNEDGIQGEDLSFIRMPVVTHQTCILSNSNIFSQIVSDTSYCAGFKNGSSVCNGDSGGGMVFERNNKWYLRGIVSVSIPLRNQNRCDPNHYVVFTDVAKFLLWIRNLQ